MLRGTLVAFEGIDGSGKSTQAREVADALRRRGAEVEVEVVAFPARDTPVGALLSEYLSGGIEMDARTAHQLFAANRSEVRARVEALLALGTCVILDRYAPSGTAYSAAKGLDAEWCEAVDSGLPAPDHVFLLNLPVDVAVARLWARTDRAEIHDQQALLERVAGHYRALAEHEPDVWTPIDATLPAAEVTASILDNLEATTDAALRHYGESG